MKRLTVDLYPCLDWRILRHAEPVRRGDPGVCSWTDAQTGAILHQALIRRSQGALDVRYAVATANGASEAQRHHAIALRRHPTGFGGEREFLLCPACHRPALCLYLAPGGPACRRCLGLAYACQAERAPARALRQARKIRNRLGGVSNPASPLPRRPRWMRAAVYAQWIARVHHNEDRWAAHEHTLLHRALDRFWMLEAKRLQRRGA